MPDQRNHVRPIRTRSKTEVSGALAAGWARVSANRKGQFADKLGIDTKTVNRALTGETLPELHTALNSLVDDLTALDELGALYGIEFRVKEPVAANDLSTVSDLSKLAGQWAEALSDGNRGHRETLALADAIRPLIKALSNVIVEADRIRAVA